MAKVKLAPKKSEKRAPSSDKGSGEIRVFTVASSQVGWALALNPHSSSQDRVEFSERLIAESRSLAAQKLSALKRK